MPNGLKSFNNINIGILLDYGEKWMGGVNYIKNLLRTILFLPEEQIPNLVIITNRRYKGIIKDLINNNDKIILKSYILPRLFCCFLPRSMRTKIYDIFRCFQIKWIIKSRRLDIIFPVTNVHDLKLPVRLIGWIADFQHLYLPEFFSQKEIETRNSSFECIADSVQSMVLSSNNAKEDFERSFPKYKGNIFVYSFCTVLENKYKIRSINELSKQFGIPTKFFYLPNQFWVHKNHKLVFQTLFKLKKEGINIQLVCTGSSHEYRNRQHFTELMQYKEINELDIINLGLVSQEILYSLYYHAHAIIQPSLFEGWSSIVEDAKAFDKIIILSDLPVHREQNSLKAIYFNPNDVNDLAEKMLGIWNQEPEKSVSFNELVIKQSLRVKENASILQNIFMTTGLSS